MSKCVFTGLGSCRQFSANGSDYNRIAPMESPGTCCWLLALLATLACLCPVKPAEAHGSVTPDADLCIIRIGFYKAHFKIYLPESHGHKEFCEDLPGIGHSIFVMEYEHDGLAETPIDFRIIENVTGQGRFTNLDQVRQLGSLADITVFHHAAAVQRDVFIAAHTFEAPGQFVGIVTVERPDGDGLYTAVFPFEAGFTGPGYWPWIISALILLQLNYLWMSGRLTRSKSSGAETAKVPAGHGHG